MATRTRSFTPTLRDREIVAAVATHRALTTDQVSLLFWEKPTASSRCRLRLRLLAEHGYLKRAEQPVALSEGRRPLVYFLTAQGRDLAAEALQVPASQVDWKPSYNSVKWPFLEHLLATNDLRVRMEVAAPKVGLRILEWVDDLSLASTSIRDQIVVPARGGGTQQTTVGPDGYVSLLAPDGKTRHRAFIEADRATVPLTRWKNKVWKYQHYFRSKAFRRRYGATKPFRVLTVTTSQERLQNMKQATEAQGATTWFWFSTYAALTDPETVLFAPTWFMAGADEPVCFPYLP